MDSLFQGERKGLHIGEPLLWIFGKRFEDSLFHSDWQVRQPFAQAGGRLIQMLAKYGCARAMKRGFIAQPFIMYIKLQMGPKSLSDSCTSYIRKRTSERRRGKVRVAGMPFKAVLRS